MPTRIELRGDTAANWTSANPVLASREPAIETDTGKFKFGDGVTAWTALPYAAAATALITAETTRAEAAEATLTAAVSTNAAAISSEAATRAAADTTEATARTAAIGVETTRATAAEGANATAITNEATTRAAAVTAEATARASAITAATAPLATTTALTAETNRATAAEGTNATAITTEATTARAAESTLTTNLATEVTNRTGGDTTNATAIAAETTRATTAENANATAISAIAAGTETKPADGSIASNVASRSGLPTVDSGATLTDGQRVLLLGQTSGSQNGLWTVHSGAWARPSDYATGSSAKGVTVVVAAASPAIWVASGTTALVVDTNVVAWVRVSALGEITVGSGLLESGNQINVDTTVVDTVTARTAAVGAETTRAQTAEALAAPLASPAFTGTPLGPAGTALLEAAAIGVAGGIAGLDTNALVPVANLPVSSVTPVIALPAVPTAAFGFAGDIGSVVTGAGVSYYQQTGSGGSATIALLLTVPSVAAAGGLTDVAVTGPQTGTGNINTNGTAGTFETLTTTGSTTVVRYPPLVSLGSGTVGSGSGSVGQRWGVGNTTASTAQLQVTFAAADLGGSTQTLTVPPGGSLVLRQVSSSGYKVEGSYTPPQFLEQAWTYAFPTGSGTSALGSFETCVVSAAATRTLPVTNSTTVGQRIAIKHDKTSTGALSISYTRATDGSSVTMVLPLVNGAGSELSKVFRCTTASGWVVEDGDTPQSYLSATFAPLPSGSTAGYVATVAAGGNTITYATPTSGTAPALAFALSEAN